MLRRFAACSVLAIAILAMMAAPAFAADWYVDVASGLDSNSGETTLTAFKSVTRGLTAAGAGDTVHVAPGSYEETTSGEAFPLAMKSGVVLQGAGAGAVTIAGNGVAPVIQGVGVDAGAMIDGFTISGGQPGLDFSGSSATISHNTVAGNRGGYSGAGIHSANGALRIVDNVIEDNWAWFGAGICSELYDRSHIEDNVVEANSGYYGVGIGCYYHAEPTIVRNVIRGNVADDGGAPGRASGAGVVAESSSLPRIAETVIEGNRVEGADGTGGAIHCYSASVILVNCLIAENTSADYAITGINSGLTEIVNSTIVNNVPGGIGRTRADWSFTVDMRNSILRGHTGSEIETGSAGSVAYSDVEGGWPGVGNIDADPLFADPVADFHLTAASPCIDAAAEETSVVTDLDGVSRPQGAGWDMGAYEYHVENRALTIEPPVLPDGPVRVGSPCSIMAEFADSGSDSHAATIDWGDGTTSAATVVGGGSGTVGGTHTYSTAGMYAVEVRVTADDSATVAVESMDRIVVYDPRAGFASAIAVLDSPAGAYPADPTAAGRLTLGFTSRYRARGAAPRGSVKVRFAAAGLEFDSTAQQWLVVTRPGDAQLKCVGRIDGDLAPSGRPYECTIWAGDGTGESGKDTVRVRISYEDASGTESVVYDNLADQPIARGKVFVWTR